MSEYEEGRFTNCRSATLEDLYQDLYSMRCRITA